MPVKELVGFVYNPRVPATSEMVNSLVRSVDLKDRSWVASAADLEVSTETINRTSMIITVGGDGTILRVARKVAPFSIPILGINMGRVGFMTELTKSEAFGKVANYLVGEQRAEKRMMLQASINPLQESVTSPALHALNDVVISRGTRSGLLDVKVSIDGATLTTYRADGVIVATATGSTGYSLAAGGPILFPEATLMVVQPIASHMSLKTALIVPPESVIELSIAADQTAILSLDELMGSEIGPSQKVKVQRSPYITEFLRSSPKSQFYSTLMRRQTTRQVIDS